MMVMRKKDGGSRSVDESVWLIKHMANRSACLGHGWGGMGQAMAAINDPENNAQ